MLGRHDQPRRRAQAKGHGRRDAPGAALGHRATRHAAVLKDQIQPPSDGGRERLVGVQRHPHPFVGIIFIEAIADRGVQELAGGRRLGGEVDIAAGASAAVVAGRALEDLDLFDVEDVAGVAAGVAHIVDEDAVRNVEAAHAEAGQAGGEAVLTRVEGDAGRVLEHVGQIARALLLEHLDRNDGDGLGGVEDGRRGLGRLDGPLEALAVDDDLAQVADRVLVLGRGRGPEGGGDRNAQSGGDEHRGAAAVLVGWCQKSRLFAGRVTEIHRL